MLHGILVHGWLVVIMVEEGVKARVKWIYDREFIGVSCHFLCSIRNSKSLSWWRISAFTGILVKSIVWYVCPLFVSGAVLFCFCPKYSYDTGLICEDNKLVAYTYDCGNPWNCTLYTEERISIRAPWNLCGSITKWRLGTRAEEHDSHLPCAITSCILLFEQCSLWTICVL